MLTSLQFPRDLPVQKFLDEYWQKQPLLLKNALANFKDPLSPEELAGFACEKEIPSRLVLEHGKQPWEVRHGPFTEADFTSLPASHYCLLVQDMNRQIPALDQLLDAFGFLPAWRMDDVMVSYAAPHGTVGPHTDQYDVFLLQGMGSRVWQINSRATGDAELIQGLDLKILRNFKAEQEWLLEPGDILYLPPGIQHHGVSDKPSMTYSIGFRAPTQLELLGDYIDQRTLNDYAHNERFIDPALTTKDNSGEITADALNDIETMLHNLPGNRADIQAWFGQLITSTSTGSQPVPLHAKGKINDFISLFRTSGHLTREMQSRFAYIENKDSTSIFIDGEKLRLTGQQAELAKIICNRRRYNFTELEELLKDESCADLLCAWFEDGLLHINEDE